MTKGSRNSAIDMVGLCAALAIIMLPVVAHAKQISAVGQPSNKPGHENGMASTMYCGNDPESWVRASAILNQVTGQVTLHMQLETDSASAGPKGRAILNLIDNKGRALATITTDEVGRGGKGLNGMAATDNLSKVSSVPAKVSRKTASMTVIAQCTGKVDRILNIDAGELIHGLSTVITVVGMLL